MGKFSSHWRCQRKFPFLTQEERARRQTAVDKTTDTDDTKDRTTMMGVDDSVCRKRKRTRTFRVCTNYNSHHPSIVSSTSWVVLLLSSLLLSTLCRVVSAGNGDNDREDDNRDDRDDPLHRIHNDNNTVENHATSLTDVMLCMGFALGWAVWMVSCTKSKHSDQNTV